MPTPDLDIATHLASEGIGTLGTDLFCGPVRDADDLGETYPDECVFVLATGGFEPEPFVGGADAPDIRRPFVQVRVRSARESFQSGQTTARAVYQATHKIEFAGYMGWLASEPTYLGKDNKSRHEWSINVQLVFEE